ncbi:hypothetical protein [Microcoleus sp. B4-D4]|uniref:hypothetical protein n=1 Tax=Microcoleus sp. B4-D4 TaxID=2818667 RepID=UPI002FD2F14A
MCVSLIPLSARFFGDRCFSFPVKRSYPVGNHPQSIERPFDRPTTLHKPESRSTCPIVPTLYKPWLVPVLGRKRYLPPTTTGVGFNASRAIDPYKQDSQCIFKAMASGRISRTRGSG